MLLTYLIYDALLDLSLPADGPPPSAELKERLYQRAIELVPPNDTANRSHEDRKVDSDAALLLAYLKGDDGSFTLLMERNLKWMVAWARKHLPEAEAEDVVQEAFIDLLHKATKLHPNATLRSFLFGILHNLVLRSQRDLARRRSEPLEGEGEANDSPVDPRHIPVDPRPNPELELLKRHPYQEIAKALYSTCDLREQQVLLFPLEGQDDKTIAKGQGITENHVRVIRRRVVLKIRKALNEPAPGGGTEP
jgi:RNA polymerase sigma factor (sigma-70 family)